MVLHLIHFVSKMFSHLFLISLFITKLLNILLSLRDDQRNGNSNWIEYVIRITANATQIELKKKKKRIFGNVSQVHEHTQGLTGDGLGNGANAPPHEHLHFEQFNLHLIFSIKLAINGDTFKHTWHLHGLANGNFFTIGNLSKNLSSIGLNTVGSTVLHILTGPCTIGGNGNGFGTTCLHEHKSSGYGNASS